MSGGRAGRSITSRFLLLVVAVVVILIVVGAAASAHAQPALATSDSVLTELGARYVYRRWNATADGRGYTLTGKVKVDILNERGRAYAHLSFSEGSFSEVRSISARLIDASGKVVTTSRKKDFRKLCGWEGYSLYADNCEYVADLRSPAYPYSIEYEYEIRFSTLFALYAPSLQADIPTVEAEFVLDVPASLRLSHKTYGIEIPLQVNHWSDRSSYTWRATNIPAFDDVDYVPPDAHRRGRIELLPHAFSLDGADFGGDSWQAIGAWSHALYRPQYGQDVVDGPANSLTGTRDDLSRITDSITSKIRYVAIEIGIGGWQPSAVDETEARGYGDCKDMTAVLVTALRRSGIQAYPVLVRTRSEGPIDPEFPDFVFNHVICMAVMDADTIWIDPTCDDCEVGDLPGQDEDVDVLVVTSAGGVLRHTPASTPEDNRVTRTLDIQVHADRSVTFTGTLTYHGNHAQYVRSLVPALSKDEKLLFVENRFDGGRKQVEIESYEFANLSDVSQPVILTLRGSGRRPVDRLGGSCYCRAFPLGSLNAIESTRLKDRTLPLDMFYRDVEIDEVAVTFSDSVQMDSVIVPSADTLETPFGAMALETRVDSGRAYLKLTRTYFRDRVRPGEFAAFEGFREKLKSIYTGNVKLVGVH